MKTRSTPARDDNKQAPIIVDKSRDNRGYRAGYAALSSHIALALRIAGVACLASSSMPLSARSIAAVAASGDGQIIDLPLGGGEHQRILYIAPAHPRATLIMLPGGSGDVGLARDGDIRHDRNFVVRTRGDWVARGYAVIIPDTVDRMNLRGTRSTPAYARLVDGLANYAHARGLVFLLGTSQGSIAAVNGASHAARGMLAGVVLTESVSVMGHSGETVFDADPQDIHIPVLIVANQDDRCAVAPPAMASRIAGAMRGSTDVRVLTVSGGVARSSNSCGSLSPHGYYGIEPEVVAAVAAWLGAHGG